MAKVAIITLLLCGLINAEETPPPSLVQKNCLACHIKQKIPSELIYRRYLLKYSTNDQIEKRLFDYLKEPKKENSIMPKQFFLKFPEKISLDLNESTLEKSIEAYLDYFDLRARLILK